MQRAPQKFPGRQKKSSRSNDIVKTDGGAQPYQDEAFEDAIASRIDALDEILQEDTDNGNKQMHQSFHQDEMGNFSAGNSHQYSSGT